MSTLTPKKAAQGQLGASAATLYTAPSSAGNKALVSEIWICNTDTNSRTYTLYAIDSGGTASSSNELAKAITIGAGYTHVLQISLILEASGFIQGLADSASKITYTIIAVEIT